MQTLDTQRPGRGGWRGGGRPSIPEAQRAKNHSIKLTDAEWAAIQSAGGGPLIRELGALLAAGDGRAIAAWAHDVAQKVTK